MFIDLMRSTCHRLARAPSRLVGMLGLCAASLLAPGGALAEQAPATPTEARQPLATPARRSRSARQQADNAFQQGRALLEAGRYREACERFELSQALDPSPGTQLNLGYCREQQGDLVQALATFEQALAGARNARDRRRRQLWGDAARERIASLTPRVPRVSVRGAPEGARVLIDERSVAVTGGPLRVNPGPHTLTVNTPGMRAFARPFELTLGQELVLDIPPPKPEEREEAREPKGAAPRPEAQKSQEHTSRYGVGPYVLGGVGAALLGTSLVTGLAATAARNQLERDCTGIVCDPSLKPTRDRADRLAALTDVFWITGAIAAGVGVTLFVIDLGPERNAPALEAGCFDSVCGLRARGSF